MTKLTTEVLKYAEIYGRAFICVDRNGSVHAVDPSQITLTILNEPAPAQPVIPEQGILTDEDITEIISSAKTSLEQYLALTLRLERKNREIPQPVSDPSNSPVIPDAYVLDELGRMTLNGVCEPRVSFGAGWNACRAEMLKAQQNEPQNIPENIPAQPVSNPYKFLDERAKYRVIIEGFSNSRSVDFEACSQEEAEEIGRDIFHEECNYGVERLESIPAQESE